MSWWLPAKLCVASSRMCAVRARSGGRGARGICSAERTPCPPLPACTHHHGVLGVLHTVDALPGLLMLRVVGQAQHVEHSEGGRQQAVQHLWVELAAGRLGPGLWGGAWRGAWGGWERHLEGQQGNKPIIKNSPWSVCSWDSSG